MQAHKMGAAAITMSYRSNPMGYHWPDTTVDALVTTSREHRILQRRHPRRLRRRRALHRLPAQIPFLPSELSLTSPNVLYPGNLYKGVVWQQNTNLFYLGAQDQYYTFNMFDAQAWFARDVMTGVIDLPSITERDTDIRHWLDRQAASPTTTPKPTSKPTTCANSSTPPTTRPSTWTPSPSSSKTGCATNTRTSSATAT
ncbi:hypothetical protein [Arthrobacter sp. QXT-31]|uniref:hypothetical protein n=1 Tax=Arthrobacter sp. QXT-31 TaxID=1357915 RepID=UPI001C12C9CB|nr:hypothetical protein [Arthrobacter sp. QXT-31]